VTSLFSFTLFTINGRPLRSITASMGLVMPAWFDMFSFNLPTGNFVPGEEDEEGMMQSIASLDELLNQLVASGVEPSRIVLGGFSQGAAMSLLTGLTTTRKLAGLFALGARLPIRQKVKTVRFFRLRASHPFILLPRWFRPTHLLFRYSGDMGPQILLLSTRWADSLPIFLSTR
jgi:predicted esterase